MTTTSGGISFHIPPIDEFLKAGVQFGHETKRWNPKMAGYIYGSKKGIHIIDVSQTIKMLEAALINLSNLARTGSVLFVGTKRQASTIVMQEAIRAGGHFIIHRWPGGLLTNFDMIKRSLDKLAKLEEFFEHGIEGRTKYEVSKMKVEWGRLNRLYGGIKSMSKNPAAIVLVDPRYEIGAVLEAHKLNIPIIAVIDSNCDPNSVAYPIPGNDDAIRSISLFMKLFADAVLAGNGGQGVKHNLQDFSNYEVKILKKITPELDAEKREKRIRIRRPEQIEIESSRVEKSKELPMANPVKAIKKEIVADDVKKVQKKAGTKPGVKSSKTKESSEKGELSPRIEKVLKENNLSLSKARKMSESDLKKIKGLGLKAIELIKGK